MGKSKSVFVTAVMGAMLMMIVACTKLLFPAVFAVLVGSLAGVGYTYGLYWFYKWISKPSKPKKEEVMEDVPEMVQGDPTVMGEIAYTYDQVKEEVLGYE